MRNPTQRKHEYCPGHYFMNIEDTTKGDAEIIRHFGGSMEGVEQ